MPRFRSGISRSTRDAIAPDKLRQRFRNPSDRFAGQAVEHSQVSNNPTGAMTVIDPAWKPHDSHSSSLGRMALLGFVILLTVLWVSHSALSARIPIETTDGDVLDGRLEAVQSQMEQIRSVVGEHSKELMTIKLGEVGRTPGIVALDNPAAQILGQGFAVTRIETEPLGQGLFVRGRIINLQAVTHQDLVFRMTAGQESVEFEVDQIDAGESRPFSTFLPSLSFGDTRYVRIDYRESTIWHRALE